MEGAHKLLPGCQLFIFIFSFILFTHYTFSAAASLCHETRMRGMTMPLYMPRRDIYNGQFRECVSDGHYRRRLPRRAPAARRARRRFDAD